MKKCTKCNNLKEISEFYKDNQKKDKITSSCKQCIDKIPRIYNKEKHRKSILKNKYGIIYQNYIILQLLQNNLCAICKNSQTKNRVLAVDHCHKTGKIRGLLCDNCNRGLGSFKDNIEIMKKAIKYIKKSKI